LRPYWEAWSVRSELHADAAREIDDEEICGLADDGGHAGLVVREGDGLIIRAIPDRSERLASAIDPRQRRGICCHLVGEDAILSPRKSQPAPRSSSPRHTVTNTGRGSAPIWWATVFPESDGVAPFTPSFKSGGVYPADVPSCN
jgi:hypothetical protein